MKRSFRTMSIGLALTFVPGVSAVLTTGCEIINADGFLGLETCDILNCHGLFFGNLADDHDGMAGMEGMDGAEAHDDEDDDHMDGANDLDDDGGHM